MNSLKILLVSAIAVSGVACTHANAAKGTPDTAASATLQPGSPDRAATAAESLAQGNADLDKALAELRDVSVFFAVDDSTLTPEAEEKLATVGALLARHPSLHVRIEGNADERGTEEYNLALGQRRAEMARTYFVRMGASELQAATVSYGKDQPKVTGHSEASWRRNRRDDVVNAPL